MSRTELESKLHDLRALLADMHTAFLVAGWVEDDLVRRMKAEMAQPRPSPHSLPLAQSKDQ